MAPPAPPSPPGPGVTGPVPPLPPSPARFPAKVDPEIATVPPIASMAPPRPPFPPPPEPGPLNWPPSPARLPVKLESTIVRLGGGPLPRRLEIAPPGPPPPMRPPPIDPDEPSPAEFPTKATRSADTDPRLRTAPPSSPGSPCGVRPLRIVRSSSARLAPSRRSNARSRPLASIAVAAAPLPVIRSDWAPRSRSPVMLAPSPAPGSERT